MSQSRALPSRIDAKSLLVNILPVYVMHGRKIVKTLLPPVIDVGKHEFDTFRNVMQLIPNNITVDGNDLHLGEVVRVELFSNQPYEGLHGAVMFDIHRNPLLYASGARLGLSIKSHTIQFTAAILGSVGVPVDLFRHVSNGCSGTSKNYGVIFSREDTGEAGGVLYTEQSSPANDSWSCIRSK